MKKMKSSGTAFLLALLFGPLGLFYASINGGLIMLLLLIANFIFSVIVGVSGNLDVGEAFFAVYVIPFIFWVISIFWAISAVSSHNEKVKKANEKSPEELKKEDFKESMDEFNSLKTLHEEGIISDEIFERKKAEFKKKMDRIVDEKDHAQIGSIDATNLDESKKVKVQYKGSDRIETVSVSRFKEMMKIYGDKYSILGIVG